MLPHTLSIVGALERHAGKKMRALLLGLPKYIIILRCSENWIVRVVSLWMA